MCDVKVFPSSCVLFVVHLLSCSAREKAESLAVVSSEKDKIKDELLSMKHSASHKDGKMMKMNKQLEKLQERVESVEKSFTWVNQQLLITIVQYVFLFVCMCWLVALVCRAEQEKGREVEKQRATLTHEVASMKQALKKKDETIRKLKVQLDTSK